MTAQLPGPLLALFTARPTLKYLAPTDFDLPDRATSKIDGVGAFLHELNEDPIPYTKTESHDQRKTRLKLERIADHKEKTENWQAHYKPEEDENIRGNPLATLFVGRLSYETTKDDLFNTFSRYGRINRARIIADPKTNKSRGYGFIVFEHEQDCKDAYKSSDFLKLNGRRVLVDVMRAKTVAGWRPRRFGGGLGGRHYTARDTQARHIGNQFHAPSGPGGFRGGYGRGGGYRGGFRGRGGHFDRSAPYPSRGFDGGAPDGAPSGPRSGGFARGGQRGGYRDRDDDRQSYNRYNRDRDDYRGGYDRRGSGRHDDRRY